MPPPDDRPIRVDVPIPPILYTNVHVLLDQLRTELGIRRRTDAGMATILTALLRLYTARPDVRDAVRDDVHEQVQERAARADSMWGPRLYGGLRP